MKTRFGFLRRVWALALCAWVMMVMGGQGAWAAPGDCVKAAEIVDAMFSTGAGAGRNGIPADYKPPCQLARGRIIGIQTKETGAEYDNSVVNGGGYVGCGQLGPWYHENPTYARGSKTPLNIRGAGNEVPNLLRAGEYLCYIQGVLKTNRCEVVAAAYNAGEGAVGSGASKSGGVQGDIQAIINNSPVTEAKKNEMRGYIGPACKLTGGIASAIADAVLALDKINDVGTGVIQALAKVIETAVVLFDDHLGPGLLSVVMVIYSIMALWAIAKLLMPFGRPGNAGQTMNGLLTLTGTVGIVALMLSNLSLLTSLVFFPIMSLMTELGDLSTGSFQSTATISSECKTAQGQSMSGDAGKDAKLLATRMTCTVDQAMQPLKQTVRISMASLKRLENLNLGPLSIIPAVDSGAKLMVLISAVPLAVMSATAILGIIATTAQAFWKIAFEFFKLAPAVAAFAFRPTRGVFATSVKGWISPIMIFAVTYSMLGLSSNIVCSMEVAKTSSGPVTLCNDSEGYVQGIAEAPYDLKAEFRDQKEGEAVFPMITKSIWISLAFFTLFINSSLRLAAKMDWVGGGGLADGLQKLVSNTLGNVEHYKAAAGKTGGLASDVAQKAWMESGEEKKKDKDKDKDPNQKEKDENKQEKDEEKKEERKKQNQETDEKNLDNRKAANNINAGRRQRTPVAP
jgi:hypothetical protein